MQIAFPVLPGPSLPLLVVCKDDDCDKVNEVFPAPASSAFQRGWRGKDGLLVSGDFASGECRTCIFHGGMERAAADQCMAGGGSDDHDMMMIHQKGMKMSQEEQKTWNGCFLWDPCS